VWQNIPNDGTVPPSSPTLFEYFRKEARTSITDNFVILGKDKLFMLAASNHLHYGSAFGASTKFSLSPNDDTLTLQNIRSAFSTYHPRLTITNLAQVDAYGHNGIWEDYVRSIKIADSVVNETWNLICSDPIYKGKTTVIITNDHGRHNNEYWYSHGDTCDGCRHIILLVLGPDTKGGAVDTIRRTQIDIAPTVGELMNVSTPLCQGRSMIPVRPPDSPIPASPNDDTINQPLSLSIRWHPVPRAEKYHVQLSTDTDFVKPLINDATLTWDSKSVGPLSVGTTYFWHVRAINAGGASAWSPTRRFTTVPTIPPIVTLTAPENAAILTKDSIDLSWNTASVEVDRYLLEIALDSLMTKQVLRDSMITEHSRVQKFFRNKAVFWWHVKAHYPLGWAEWSATRRFIVDIPQIVESPVTFTLSFEGNSKQGSPLRLNYALPKASRVTISLFTMRGQRIGKLLDSWQAPAYYTIAMPIRTVPRGFYLLEFTAGSFQKTKRVFRY